jgi:hypothetical protein
MRGVCAQLSLFDQLFAHASETEEKMKSPDLEQKVDEVGIEPTTFTMQR